MKVQRRGFEGLMYLEQQIYNAISSSVIAVYDIHCSYVTYIYI